MDRSVVTKYSEAIQGIDTRSNLSELRQDIKDEEKRGMLSDFMLASADDCIALLQNEDPKVRKNIALLMGEIGLSCFCDPLLQAYERETQRFVRPAYLIALRSYDLSSRMDELKAQSAKLLNDASSDEENKKHTAEELRALTELIVRENGIENHEFKGFSMPVECILLTNRGYREVTQNMITTGRFIPLSAGVRIKGASIQELLPIRTYSEMLFLIPGASSVTMDPLEASRKIARSELMQILDNGHTGKPPYYFRVELKSDMDAAKKGSFIRHFASQLELLTGRNLINSPGEYEFEIRLIETREGLFNVLLKLFTIKDDRFAYRTESIASSIRPVNAALLVELAKEYMIDDAQVLDPFCGVGTMLIERQKVVKANTSYGIDIYDEAIQKAKINTEAAGQIIHFVNKDFFQFDHEYLFDEIFTNMPFQIGRKTKEEIYDIYYRFFGHAKNLLKEKATIIMYTHDRGYIRQLAPQSGFRIVKEFEIQKREGTYLVILRN